MILPSFFNLHSNQSIIICGCGSSIKDFTPPSGMTLFGVNDVERFFPVDYLLVVNDPSSFLDGRYSYIEKSESKYIFTHLRDLPTRNLQKRVFFELGEYSGYNIEPSDKIDYSVDSPYMATILASMMGFNKIGLIGVDYTNHKLSNRLPFLNTNWGNLCTELEKKGISLVNLSENSILTTIPKGTVETLLKF